MAIRKVLLFLSSIVGMIDSFYLTDRHYNANGSCSSNVDEFLGYPVDCGYIDSTKYSEILSFPVAIIGLLYYLSIFLVLYFDNSIDKGIKIVNFTDYDFTHIDAIVILSFLGLLYSTYLIYVQFGILEVVCIYCIYSAASTSVIFGTSISYKFLRT